MIDIASVDKAECFCRCHRNRLRENTCPQCKCLSPVYELSLLKQECERLKRLDDNVKKHIECLTERPEFFSLKEILEALYK